MLKAAEDLTGLMTRVAGGDRTAFVSLYEAMSAKLFGTIIRILRRRDVSEDVLQDVFVKIWQRASDYDPQKASPVTWMATIARNAALDVARKKTTLALDDVPEAMEVADPAIPALTVMETNEDLARLNRCIDGLEPERRQLVRLAYLEGLSREELGQRLGAPIGTIKTWLHRSLKQLKDCLGA